MPKLPLGAPASLRLLLWLVAPICTILGLSWISTPLCAQETPPRGRASTPSQEQTPRRVPWTSSRIRGTPDPPPPFTVEPAFPHLRFEFPVVLIPAPGSDRLFVGDLNGRIWSFPADPSSRTADLALDLGRQHPALTALYGMVFHPQFEKNRYIYVCYVLENDRPDGSVVARFQVNRDDPPTIDPASERVILRFWSGGHNGGCLEFGNDGYLYISTGDGTGPSPPDVKLTGQDCSDLLSSILRIDVDGHDPQEAYRVPPDNPFVGREGVRPEIWAFGFRNPWKMSVDRETGDLWVGDVGWELWEMIHRVERGGNYGWSVMEGPQPVHAEGAIGPSPILPPTKAHPHSEAASITGGYVYRGSRLPQLTGVYVYGDYQTGTVWGLRHDGKGVTWHGELARTPLHLAAFGVSNDGELFLVDHDRTHQIYRLIPNDQSNRATDFPRRLSETGLFESTFAHRPAPGVEPYAINVELWADGASAERLIAIPGAGQLRFDDQGYGQLPEGSVLVRTVSITTGGEGGKVPQRRRVETQILHLEAEAWRPYSYVWTDDQTDALLAESGGSVLTLKVSDPREPQETFERTYRVHSRAECMLCHNPWVEKQTTIFGVQSASPLAVHQAQWDRPRQSGTGSSDQLAHFREVGLLASEPVRPVSALARIDDESASLERRVRSYLHVNCSHCHQFNAGGSANIVLGMEVPLEETRTVDVRPIQGTFGIDGARIIAPGDPSRSILYYRMSKLGGGRMPRIGSNQVDARTVRLVRQWIAAMPSPADEAAAGGPRSRGMAVEDQEALECLRAGADVSSLARQAAIRRLASTPRGALLLLDQLIVGEPPENLRREILAIVGESPRIEVRDLFERFIPERERVRRLGDAIDPSLLLGMEGDPQRGRQIFATSPSAQCRNCHQIGGVGTAVGPDLSKIGSKYDRAALLDHILNPSRLVEPPYVSHLVETRDGRIASGILMEKGDQELVLKDVQGQTIRIPRDEVEQFVPQARSLMPELLLRDLTAQQAADLLAYLASLRE
jgi:uncharacterized repeat protein (TIGR03806 family)